MLTLYQFGFKRRHTENGSGKSTDISTDIEVPHCMPSLEEARTLGLGEAEYKRVLNETSDAVIDTTYKKQRVAVIDTTYKKQRVARGKYTKYSNEDHAKIGKYALENGNERARKHFLIKYPLLTESTVRNFKKSLQ